MKKDRVINAIKSWNEIAEKNICKWTFAEELKEKHRAKIQQGFGSRLPVGDWIAVYDDSLMGNGKKGMIFTSDYLYLWEEEPVLLEQVQAAYKMDSLACVLKMKDGSYETYSYKCGIEKAIPILQKLAGMEQAEQPPKEAYEALHTTYGRELRRRMNHFTKQMCQKSNRVVSIETAGAEFVENALSRRGEIDKSKVLAFLVTTHTNGKEAIVFTEEAVYSGTSEKVKISFDGLTYLLEGENSAKYAIYENHFAERSYLYVFDEDKTLFHELVNGYITIYSALQKEIAEGNVEKSGLDLTEGWNRYLQNMDDYFKESYKNAVFVSSTFRDMHYERDIIHEKVQPALSSLADRYGETISFCDLRWGVNTENLDSEEGAKKVLVVCLDEIERCNPYMLIMLGERYGWIPSERTIKNALESRPSFELEELEKSVTALEIEFGALAEQTEKERIFVYFREMEHAPSNDYVSEDAFHEEKLAKLKARVRKLAPDRVKTYRLSWDEQSRTMHGVDEFAKMVIEDIGKTMEEVWSKKEPLTPFEEEVQQHVTYMKQKAGMCCAREEILKRCLSELENGAHLLALTGTSGCGKSTVMGALGSILMENDAKVLPMFCGLTAKTESAMGLIGQMCYYAESLLGVPHLEEEKKEEEISEELWQEYFAGLITRYSKEKEEPLFFVIDAVDQLAADHMRNSLKFIPNTVDVLGSKVYMILSCLDDFELAAFPKKMALPMLTNAAKPQVIKGILRRNRRELDDAVTQSIVKKKASDSPLYLTLLIQRLLMMNKNDFDDIVADGDGMSAITKHQLSIVEHCSEDISGICREMIEVAATRMGGDFVKQAIAFIAISQHGLRESDLESLLLECGIQWNRLTFSLFINYLRNIFVLREDGCYDFSHKIFRREFTYEKEEKKELHRKLCYYLETLPEHDFLRERELLDHCMEARESEGFMRHVAKWMEQKKPTKDLNQKMLTICRQDKARWLIEMVQSLIQSSLTAEQIRYFLHYVTEEIGRAFDNSKPDLEIRETLYIEMLPVAEYLAEKEGGLVNERRVSVIYSRLGTNKELVRRF